MNKLRQHQIESLQKTLDNNFESGVHFHATGTGKSLIARRRLKSDSCI